MKPASFYRKSFAGAASVLFISFGCGIGAGAQTQIVPGDTPELAASTQAVEKAKAKLDQCHKQLEASRALLRAAEAEYKAAVASKSAVSLRTHAKQLADLSGLPSHISDSAPVVVPVDLQSLPALGVGQQVKSGQPAPVAQTGQSGQNNQPIDLTPTRINTVDFNAEPLPAPAPGAKTP